MTTQAKKKLFLNHYKTKSQEEWDLKVKTTNNYGYMKGKWVDKPLESYNAKCNVDTDTKILRYVPKLKEAMTKPIGLNPSTEPYPLGLVCMFRDEDPYLKEWLDYYIMQGVNHFYLYDNENPKSTMEVLAPYIVNKWVTIIPWPDSVMDGVSDETKRKIWSDYHDQHAESSI